MQSQLFISAQLFQQSWIRSMAVSCKPSLSMLPSFAAIQPSLPPWDIEGVHVFRDMFDLCPEFFDPSVLRLVDENYLSPFCREADTLLVRSAMGTGKTFAMTNWVKEQLAVESTTRVFFLVPRISMADRILGGLRAQGIEAADYRTAECNTLSKSTALGFRCFVVCTESIVKFLFGNDLPMAEPQPDRWPLGRRGDWQDHAQPQPR